MFLRYLPRTTFRDPDSHRVIDLVLFFRYAYDFWYHRGRWKAFVVSLIGLANCLIVWLAAFTFAFVIDWDVVYNCRGEECGKSSLFKEPHVASWRSGHPIFSFIFLMSCGVAVLWESKRCVESYYLHDEIHEFVSANIDVGDASPFHRLRGAVRVALASRSGHELLAESRTTLPSIDDISWDQFLQIFCTLLHSDRGIVNSRAIDELRVVQTLMCIDNYHIALHHHGVLTGPLGLVDDKLVTFLIESMMNDHRLRDGATAESHLRQELKRYTIAYWVLYPFIVSFLVTKLLIKTVAEWKARPEHLFQREWSSDACWKMRLYNEVPHIVGSRLLLGRERASKMLSKIQSSPEGSITRVCQRLAATFLFGVVILTAVNSALLNYGTVGERSLVWWASVCILAYGVVSPDPPSNREYGHAKDLEALVHELHYEQPEWAASPTAFAASIGPLFPRKMSSLCWDLFSILAMPLILSYAVVSPSLENFVGFMKSHSQLIDGVGSVVASSAFNFREPSSSSDDLAGECRQDQSYEWKKEKSVMSFACIYSNWRTKIEAADDLGVSLVLGKIFAATSAARRREDEPADEKPEAPTISHDVEHMTVSVLDDMQRSTRRQGSQAA